MDALLKCYDEARLADTWLTEHGNEVWTLLRHDFRPQAVQKRQFIIAAYQRCAWPSFPPLFRPILRPASHIHRHDSHLNLEGHFSSLTEADFAPGKPHSLLSNQHFSRFCRCLQPGSRIDYIPCDGVVLAASNLPHPAHDLARVHSHAQS